MTEYDNEMKGVLFANSKRETDKHPNAKGSAQINGVEYWVSAWTNTSAKGAKYQSLKFEPKGQAGSLPEPSVAPDDLDDRSIPF